MNISTELRIRMAEQRMMGTDVAKLVSRSPRTVYRWTAGKHGIPKAARDTLAAHGLLSENRGVISDDTAA